MSTLLWQNKTTNSFTEQLAKEICSVQPMVGNIGTIFSMKARYRGYDRIKFKKTEEYENVHIWTGEFYYKTEKEYHKIRQKISDLLSCISVSSKINTAVRIYDLKKGIVRLTFDDADNAYFLFLHGSNNFEISFNEGN